MTTAQFRAQHGDPTTWSSADFDSYETAVSTTNPVFAQAAAAGEFVYGRHDENGRTVVDLMTADELAEQLDAHRAAAVHHLLLGGTTRSGKNPPAPLTHTAA